MVVFILHNVIRRHLAKLKIVGLIKDKRAESFCLYSLQQIKQKAPNWVLFILQILQISPYKCQ